MNADKLGSLTLCDYFLVVFNGCTGHSIGRSTVNHKSLWAFRLKTEMTVDPHCGPYTIINWRNPINDCFGLEKLIYSPKMFK